MQLNVLDDLAEAMKALDGKKYGYPDVAVCDEVVAGIPCWCRTCSPIL